MTHITVIPAQPGYVSVHATADHLSLGSEVIAWRIETEISDRIARSTVYPITVPSEPGLVGVRNPDGTVTLLQDNTYASLADADAAHQERQISQ